MENITATLSETVHSKAQQRLYLPRTMQNAAFRSKVLEDLVGKSTMTSSPASENLPPNVSITHAVGHLPGRTTPGGPAVDIVFDPHFDLWNAEPVSFRMFLLDAYPSVPPVVFSHARWPDVKNPINRFGDTAEEKKVSEDGKVHLYMCSPAGWLDEYPLEAIVYGLRHLMMVAHGDEPNVPPLGTLWPNYSPVPATKGIDFGTLDLTFFSHEEQGMRSSMEDAIVSCVPLKTDKREHGRYALFGVMDGHGGPVMSKFGARRLPDLLSNYLDENMPIRPALYQAIVKMDEEWLEAQNNSPTPDESGSTVCVVSIDTNEYKVFCANLGDSRAVLCRDDTAVPLSFDQKPSNPRELSFICHNGGFVTGGRINGSIAVARAAGDMYFKEEGYRFMDNRPDIVEVELQPKDRFILCACDGLFDVMTNDEVVAFVLTKKHAGNSMDEIPKLLISHAINELGSTDNVSACIVTLGWDAKFSTAYAPPPTPVNKDDYVPRRRSRTKDRRATTLFDQSSLKEAGIVSKSASASEKVEAVKKVDPLHGTFRPEGSAGSTTTGCTDTQAHHPWTIHNDDEGREYYYNSRTKVSSWEKPEILKWEKASAEGKEYYYNTETLETSWTLPLPDTDD